MTTFSEEALLGLSSIPTIGPARMRKFISLFGSPEAVLDASARQLMDIDGVDTKTAKRIKDGPDELFVRHQLKALKSYDVHLLTFWDQAYPDRLKRIFDPPVFLFAKGDDTLLTTSSIGVVGTRVPSPYGRTITEQLVKELTGSGLTIISGFARGVDTIAHKTALDHNGKTIAVLGNGLDVVYPAENNRLLEGFRKNGLILSEYPFGTKPDAGNFPKRNRIISGISLGVLITEAGAKSGALLTAMYALDQNREVFAVPGPINSGKSAGCNALLRQGAKLVQSVDDIFQEIGYLQPGEKAASVPKEEPKLEEPALTIFRLLDGEPLHIDQLAMKAGISTSEALTALLILELNGHVRQMAGKMFTRL